MRTKLLMAIACLLSVCIGFSACVKGNDEQNVEVNISTYVTDFGIDTINGTYYKFSIDQLNHIIFNEDSLPVGSEDLLESIAIKTFSASGYITSGLLDSIVVVGNKADLTPSINKPGNTFKIISNDGSRWQEYSLQINVHKQDPDVISWVNLTDVPEEFKAAQSIDQKVLKKGNDLLVMLSNNLLMKADVSNPNSYVWQTLTMQGLPDDALLHSALCYNDTCYMITVSGDVYNSVEADTWQKNDVLSGDVKTLLAAFSGKLTAIREVDGENLFCFTTATDAPWTDGEQVDADFPTEKVNSYVYVSSAGVERAILTGMPLSESDRVTPWMTVDGDDWGAMSTSTDYYCPALNDPTVILYDGFFYILGSGLDVMYESIGGLVWGKTVGKFTLPQEVSGHDSYALKTDESGFIWLLVIGNSGEDTQIWRGRLNKFNT
ncbi:MAG: DUF6242 domain-containing protein [Bacteroidaceae bacterium]|nr:DUF6242 domain-containing protein [Bacteroidaceae bacterium]